MITNSVVLHCDSETRSVREPRQSQSDYFQMNYENPERRERDREARELLSPLALLSCLCLVSVKTKSRAWGEIPAQGTV